MDWLSLQKLTKLHFLYTI